jgi:hypothetical protein
LPDYLRHYRQLSDDQAPTPLLAYRYLAGIDDHCLADGQPVNQPDAPGPTDDKPVFARFWQRLLPRAAMLAGIGGVVADPRNLVSFSVLFGMSQNIGGLLGSAILGTFQTWREKYHSSLLADQLTTLNPLVNERLQLYSQMYQSMIGDSITERTGRHAIAERLHPGSEYSRLTILIC